MTDFLTEEQIKALTKYAGGWPLWTKIYHEKTQKYYRVWFDMVYDDEDTGETTYLLRGEIPPSPPDSNHTCGYWTIKAEDFFGERKGKIIKQLGGRGEEDTIISIEEINQLLGTNLGEDK